MADGDDHVDERRVAGRDREDVGGHEARDSGRHSCVEKVSDREGLVGGWKKHGGTMHHLDNAESKHQHGRQQMSTWPGEDKEGSVMSVGGTAEWWSRCC